MVTKKGYCGNPLVNPFINGTGFRWAYLSLLSASQARTSRSEGTRCDFEDRFDFSVLLESRSGCIGPDLWLEMVAACSAGCVDAVAKESRRR